MLTSALPSGLAEELALELAAAAEHERRAAELLRGRPGLAARTAALAERAEAAAARAYAAELAERGLAQTG